MIQQSTQTLLHTVLSTESIDTLSDASSHIADSVQRVAILTESFLPKIDGVSRTALLTIKYLESTGRDVIVFAPGRTPSQVSRTPIYPIPSLWLPFYDETRVTPPWPFLIPTLRAFKPDVIHLFSPLGLGLIGMIAGSILDTPVLANYQTDLPAYTESYGYGFLRPTIIRLLRYIHNGCTLTLAPSSSTLRELRQWDFRRLRRWERGVDTQRFTPARRSESSRLRLLAGRDPSRMLVLYVGRMAKEKHLEALHVIAADPSLALTLVGGGNYLPNVQQALAGTDVHFTGTLVGDELADAFAAADVFVFPGPEETFGQVVLEALASGLPAIVTDRGGPATIVQDGQTGFICAVDDANAFADRVRTLRDNPDLHTRMANAARETAEQRPWLAVMGQLEGYYAEASSMQQRLRRAQRNEWVRS